MLPALPLPAAAIVTRPRPKFELADVLREYGGAYRRAHPLPRAQLKVMRAVEVCRTAALGGHLEQCDACGFRRPAYNSCRNRHCPKCQSLAKARWLEERQAELLPVAYFHLVFTLPHELNPLALINKRVVCDLLFRAVAEALLEFGRTHLGGKLGVTAVLHTWDQTLLDHFHLHCLVPAGALALDHSRWIPARAQFLFPVRALSLVFRGKFLASLRQARVKDELEFHGRSAALAEPEAFNDWLRRLGHKSWVVYAKPPFGSPARVLDYLGRYTHRVAISNHRLISVGDDQVTFSYRDRRGGHRPRAMTLGAEEFIRRFLLHVLPDGLQRIRHFGLLANRVKKQDLARCRELLGAATSPPAIRPQSPRELLIAISGIDFTRCPACRRGRMVEVGELPGDALTTARLGAAHALALDSS